MKCASARRTAWCASGPQRDRARARSRTYGPLRRISSAPSAPSAVRARRWSCRAPILKPWTCSIPPKMSGNTSARTGSPIDPMKPRPLANARQTLEDHVHRPQSVGSHKSMLRAVGIKCPFGGKPVKATMINTAGTIFSRRDEWDRAGARGSGSPELASSWGCSKPPDGVFGQAHRSARAARRHGGEACCLTMGAMIASRASSAYPRQITSAPSAAWRGRGAGHAARQVLEAMDLHLEEISRAVAPNAHAVVLLDQAAWHTTAKLGMSVHDPACEVEARRTSPSCLCHPSPRSSIPPKMSGNTSARTGSPIVSSTPRAPHPDTRTGLKPSSRPLAKPGTT